MSGKVCYNNLIKLLIDKGLKKKRISKNVQFKLAYNGKTVKKRICFHGCFGAHMPGIGLYIR